MNNKFRMPVENKFEIDGGGVVASGQIESGTVTVGDNIELLKTNGQKRQVLVKAVEIFQKITDTATQGENVGLLLADISEDDVSSGDILQAE